MTTTYRLAAGLALLLPLLPLHAQAADCDSNFTTSGSILTGKRFTTHAELPNVTADGAYQAALQSIAKQGFIIKHSDSSARVITAVDSNSAPGRPAPLNASVEPAQGGAAITLTFGIPAGAFAPEGSVKDEFYKIVRAAASPRQEIAGAAPPGAQQRPGDAPAGIGHAAAATGSVCMAKACIGMSLEEAAKLNLKTASASGENSFPQIGQRYGHYGLDANGKLVGINNWGGIDRVWIRQFLQSVRTMCQAPAGLGAQISASDGTPIQLGFSLGEYDGKVGYALSSVTRLLPDNMSTSERRKLLDELRNRYGRAFIENNDIARTIKATNGELNEGAAMLNPTSISLLGPGTPRGLGAKLMEQPGCSNRIQLD